MSTLTLHPAQRWQLLFVQLFTLAWMLVECGVALYSAWRAHSAALLAFGADSLVELLSAALVLFTLAPSLGLSGRTVNRLAGALLFLLAAVVALGSVAALSGRLHAEPSLLGVAVTAAALVIMPGLAWAKRRLARSTGNNALAADAVQSATCAYLAAVTLAGLALNALFGFAWADAVAALLAVPLLLVEGRRAMHGQSCGCTGQCH